MTEPVDLDEARRRLAAEQPPEPDPFEHLRATRSAAIKQTQGFASNALHKTQAHAKRAEAALRLIESLDESTDACVVIEEATNIVEILVHSAEALVSAADLADGWARNIDTARPDE